MAYQCILYGGECDGCGRCQEEEKKYYCPVCGEEVDSVYVDNEGDILGCENCVSIRDAGEVLDD